jgi:hypothetical protein
VADRYDGHAERCCSEPDVSMSLADGADDGCCPLNPDEAPSCGCLHGAANAALPTVATAPPTGNDGGPDLDLLAELPPAIVAVTTPRHSGSTCRGSPRPVPAHSLLSLGCLLTT